MPNVSTVLRLPVFVGVLWLACLGGLHADAAELVGHWACDGLDDVALIDSSPAARDGDLLGARRARGAFGTALHFDGKNASAILPVLPELDGSDALTVQAWVLWEGTGRYPNILTGGQWSPGGFMIFVRDRECSFRMGRPGHKHGRPGDQWLEVGVPFLKELPLRRWVHLAAVFERPRITTYVDGKQVATSRWDHCVGVAGDMKLGKWLGHETHSGLIDDVKIYAAARTPAQIAADIAATNAGRESTAYEIVNIDVSALPRLAVLENKLARLEIGERGRILSITERESGRELLDSPAPLATVTVGSSRLVPRSCTRIGDRFDIVFSRNKGSASLRVTTAETYFRIEVLGVKPETATSIGLLPIVPTCSERRGAMASMASDEASGICIRALNLQTNVAAPVPGRAFSASASGTYGMVGAKVALVAGPIGHMKEALQQVALEEGIPVSRLGGPFSMDAEANRGSYVFAHVTTKNVDRWIETARRGGFDCIHFQSGWHKSLGHYEINTSRFPKGMDDLKATVDRIHAAGLRAGMHTLTGCISTRDSWVSPVPDPRLKADASYTLAKPIGAATDVVYVNELPAKHDVVWTYSSDGNALRVGSEMIQYGAVVREKPYAFMECKRGAFKTEASAHPTGTAVDHLLQRYLAFYPDETTDLVGELSDCIANAYNTCGFDQIYQDGSEGMRGWHPVAVIRSEIYRRLKRPALVEASCGGHFSWWFHSRRGAWDHPKWAPKRFTDRHVESVTRWRTHDLLEPHMGWWALIGPSSHHRGMFPDEVEYLVGKTLGIDASMSVQGVRVDGRKANARQEEYFTLLGWYEKLRLARWFDDATQARLRELGAEFRLRQDDRGSWQFYPLQASKHRVTAMGNGSEAWMVRNPYGKQPLRVRLEALYAVDPYDSPRGTEITDFAGVATAWTLQEAKGVSQAVNLTTDMVKVGAQSLQITARNETETRRGAWTRARRTFEPYLNLGPAKALGFWVHGDGKGEVLNLQLTTPREFRTCEADHMVTIDFTGWRYVEFPFRERSAEQHRKHVWPYSGLYAIYRNPLRTATVNSFSVYLNNLPPGEEARVLVSPVRALPVRSAPLTKPALMVAGRRVEFPVSLVSGEYLEVDENPWGTLYDARGAIRTRFPLPAAWPDVDGAGELALQFDCVRPEGFSARAEITLFHLGEAFGTRAGESGGLREYVGREYVRPFEITAGDRAWNRRRVLCRSQGNAHLELSIEALAGSRFSAAAETTARLVDAGADAAAYELSKQNRYVKYAYDGSNRDTPSNPGVSVTIGVSKDAKVGNACLLFAAESTRRDSRGWGAKGRHCSPPLDLSKHRSLGFWLHGDGKGESFKLQLHDTAGAWFSKVVPVDFVGWRRITCDLLESGINLSAVEYILLFYNNIPAGTRVACRFDELRALGDVAGIPAPAVTVNGQTISFPVDLGLSQSLSWSGGETAQVLDGHGQEITQVRIVGALPRLQPGLNEVGFSFPATAPLEARAKVRLVKVY